MTNKYILGGKTYLIADGELFERIDPAVGGGALIAEIEEPQAEPIKKRKARKASKSSGETDYEAIKSDLRGGEKPGVIAVRHNVPYWKVMYAKKQMNDAGEMISKPKPELLDPTKGNIKTYQCVGGHRFSSNLKQSDAKCPTCHQKVFREIKDQSTL